MNSAYLTKRTRHEANPGDRTMATVYGSKPVGADGRYVDSHARSGGENSRYQTFERDLYQRCRADRAAELPKLPPSGRGHAVFHDDVRRNAALGPDDEANGGYAGDAAMV